MSAKFNPFQVIFILISQLLAPRYDARLQLLTFQIKMLRERIDAPKILTTPEERAEMLRLGAQIDHAVADVMKVVKPRTYHGWRKDKSKEPKGAGRPGTPEATVNLILRFVTENPVWGYSRIVGELKKLGIKIG